MTPDDKFYAELFSYWNVDIDKVDDKVDNDTCYHAECQGHECMSFGTSACPETRPY